MSIDTHTTTTSDTATTDSRAAATRTAVPRSPEARAAEALPTPPEVAARQAAPGSAAAHLPADQPVDSASAPEPTSGTGSSRRRDARPADPAAALVPVPRTVQDAVLLLARLVLGVVLVAHGVQKLAQGVAGTAEGFGQMGIPLPEVAAVFAMVAEIGGGALLVLGLLTPLAALLPAVVMAGAVTVHAGNGIFVSEGGWEFAATLGVGALALAVAGPGRLSLDALIARARRR